MNTSFVALLLRRLIFQLDRQRAWVWFNYPEGSIVIDVSPRSDLQHLVGTTFYLGEHRVRVRNIG